MNDIFEISLKFKIYDCNICPYFTLQKYTLKFKKLRKLLFSLILNIWKNEKEALGHISSHSPSENLFYMVVSGI